MELVGIGSRTHGHIAVLRVSSGKAIELYAGVAQMSEHHVTKLLSFQLGVPRGICTNDMEKAIVSTCILLFHCSADHQQGRQRYPMSQGAKRAP